MRMMLLVSIAIVCGGAVAVAASASPLADRARAGAGQAIVEVAVNCPPGSRWLTEGYDRKGKYRPAHCSTKR